MSLSDAVNTSSQLSAAHADATSDSPSLDVLCTNHSADASNADDSVKSAPLSSAVMAVDDNFGNYVPYAHASTLGTSCYLQSFRRVMARGWCRGGGANHLVYNYHMQRTTNPTTTENGGLRFAKRILLRKRMARKEFKGDRNRRR